MSKLEHDALSFMALVVNEFCNKTNCINSTNEQVNLIQNKIRNTSTKANVPLKVPDDTRYGIFPIKSYFQKILYLNLKKWNDVNSLIYDDVPEVYKSINNNPEYVTLFVKMLYWYFRKIVVDLVLADVNKKIKLKKGEILNTEAVGSVSLTSDYDITVYSNYMGSSTPYVVSRTFEKNIENLFSIESDVLFDTNIYYSSFAREAKEGEPDSFECNPNQFVYIFPANRYEKQQQHVWAALKIIQGLKKLNLDLFPNGDEIYLKLQELYDILIKDSTRVEPAYNLESEMIKRPETRDGRLNYLSWMNFKSKETYFTRGAFIDIVLNLQKCKSRSFKIETDEYIDSLVENFVDLSVHVNKKEKYIKRIMMILTNFFKLDDTDLPSVLYRSNSKCLLKFAWEIIVDNLNSELVDNFVNTINLDIFKSTKLQRVSSSNTIYNLSELARDSLSSSLNSTQSIHKSRFYPSSNNTSVDVASRRPSLSIDVASRRPSLSIDVASRRHSLSPVNGSLLSPDNRTSRRPSLLSPVFSYRSLINSRESSNNSINQ
jgi:hypothetical protein